MYNIETLHGEIKTPAFLPDATYGTIKSLSFRDIENCGVEAMVTTTLHLEQKLDSNYIQKYGGLHKFFNWNKPILTDSGGFQVFSLIHRKKNKAHVITEAGCSFKNLLNGRHDLLTPESSQTIQHNLGSDIRVVLDEPVLHDSSINSAKEAVARTTRWAKRAKKAFLELNNLTENDFNNSEIKRPLLVGVVQGGSYFDLRKRSAEELEEIGFDIYGFGGIPLHKETTWREGGSTGFYHELVSYVSELLPGTQKYGLGIGTPDDITYCVRYGWGLFDTVLPTRNARHGYLYVASGQGDAQHKSYDVLHVNNSMYAYSEEPIDPTCNCEACSSVSRAYLRYLLKIGDPAGWRLATIHNLTLYARVIAELQGAPH